MARHKLPEVPVSEAEKKDPALHMEMQTLRGERDERGAAEAAQVERESLIAQTHEMIGRIQGFKAISEFADVGRLVWLKEVKESKIYRDLPTVGTWDKLCNYIGLSRQKVDEDLSNLATFGEKFLTTVGSFSIGYRELRQLRQLTYDGESFHMAEDGKTVVIEGQAITLDEEAAPELEAALEKLLVKNKEIRERNTKLEKEFSAAVKEETKGLTLEKKALVKEIERLKAFDPEDKDRGWSVEQMKAIEKMAGEFAVMVAKFIVDPRLKDDRHLQALVSGHLQEGEMALHDVRQRLDEIIDMF